MLEVLLILYFLSSSRVGVLVASRATSPSLCARTDGVVGATAAAAARRTLIWDLTAIPMRDGIARGGLREKLAEV